MSRRIDVITVGRSDFGIYRPVLDALAADGNWDVGLIVSGGHLDETTGVSLQEIEKSGHAIRAKIPLANTHDDAAGMGETMGAATAALSRFYRDNKPDCVLVLGDRYEMMAFTAALVPFNVPIAHIHGGELSFGAIDDVFRHAITKMSHLHFAATADYGSRIIRMGEEPWRVTVSGAPGLDTAHGLALPSRAALEQQFGLDLSTPPILVTYHPVTRQLDDLDDQVGALMSALAERPEPIIFTAPNLDAGGLALRAAIERFVADRTNATLVESFGHANYFAILREAVAAVGNSSSGLIETPAFKLPTLNIGDRQQGRTRAKNVVDVACTHADISRGLLQILQPDFRARLADLENPYGNGNAAKRIVAKLNSVDYNSDLTNKLFFDVDAGHLNYF